MAGAEQVRVDTIPFIPYEHGELEDIGNRTHAQIDAAIDDLQATVLGIGESGVIGYLHLTNFPPNTSAIDLANYGLKYTPNAHCVLLFGNYVKQVSGIHFTETNEHTITFVGDLDQDDDIEIYLYPLPPPAP